MTAIGLIALAYALFVGWSVCRAIAGFDKAEEEMSRDREWWRGLSQGAEAAE